MVTLETERLILRSWNLDDAEDFYEYAKNPDVGPNAGWKPHDSKEESMSILKNFIEKDEVWAIVCKENNKVIGSLGLHNDGKRDKDINAKMVGYVLSKDYWGKGLMTEAVKRVIQFAFEDVKVDLLSCYHFSFNVRSKRVILKCGFKYEGTLRLSYKLFDGTTYDDCCYSISHEDYFNHPKTNARLYQSHCVFPTPDIIKTADYYEKVLDFRAVRYLDAKEPHICLYRDATEIILTKSKSEKVIPNRVLYGYGYDAYFITDEQEKMQTEFEDYGVKIVRTLSNVDYHNKEFVIEDIDGRWIGFGIKEG
jgi:[ribosomal protein S5]-alanine N-acetyltransferase